MTFRFILFCETANIGGVITFMPLNPGIDIEYGEKHVRGYSWMISSKYGREGGGAHRGLEHWMVVLKSQIWNIWIWAKNCHACWLKTSMIAMEAFQSVWFQSLKLPFFKLSNFFIFKLWHQNSAAPTGKSHRWPHVAIYHLFVCIFRGHMQKFERDFRISKFCEIEI